MLLLLALLLPLVSSAQRTISEEEALRIVNEAHPAILAAQASSRSARLLQDKAARQWEPAEIYHNIAADPDLGMFGTSTFGVTQVFPAARQTRAQQRLYTQRTRLQEAQGALLQQQLGREVRTLFQHLAYLSEKRKFLLSLDSLYRQTAAIAESRYRNGEIAQDEQLLARDQASQIRLELETVGHETSYDKQVLAQFLGLRGPILPILPAFDRRLSPQVDSAGLRNATALRVYAAQASVAEEQVQVEKARLAPQLAAGLNLQYLGNGALYPGYQLGLRLPLARQALRTEAAAAELQAGAASQQLEAAHRSRQMELAHLQHEVEKYEILVAYFDGEGRRLAAELRRASLRRYQAGEIDYLEFAQAADRALRMEMDYLDHQYQLNQTILEIETLSN